jgi:hypothetical protein
VRGCPVCGETTGQPIRAALEHFSPVAWGQWHYWPGNIKSFGFWSGMSANLALSFPIYNTLRYWKHRKTRLRV